jgi:release factor glutamine methyltransferase
VLLNDEAQETKLQGLPEANRENKKVQAPSVAVRTSRTSPDTHDPAAVYPPREDTELLRPFAEGTRGLRVLEIGTGNGRVAETAARAGASVVATDRNPTALRSLRSRASSGGFSIHLVRTDLADGLRRFDLVLANPPYLPTPFGSRDPDPWVNLALDGGIDGCATLARILSTLPEHLLPDGRAYVVESSLQDPTRRDRLRADWQRSGGACRRVAERRIGDERLEVWEWRLAPPATAGST